MASSAAWRVQFGFRARMAARTNLQVLFFSRLFGLFSTEKLTSASTSLDAAAFPHKNMAETQLQAKILEEDVFKEALSEEDYHQRCNQRVSVYMATIQERQKGRDAQPTIESSSMPAPKPQQVGPFPNCTYHETGSFSTVYRHEGLDPPRVLAIKVASDFKTQHHSAKREARILSKASHENIIPLLETYQLASSFILVFPFQPLDLARLLAAGPIQILQARSVLRNVFSALAHVHGLNIIHRDIKPSNILLTTANGPAYLADFGIAWMAGEKTSEAEDCKITDVGTTSYRPPELLFGHKAYDCTLDLWATGCVVAEVINAIPHACSERARKWTLFDSGELGSDLALIKSIFETLGTPTEEKWPEVKNFADWGKMNFKEYLAKSWADILPHASEMGRDLVASLVKYQSTDRMSAAEAQKHGFFSIRHNEESSLGIFSKGEVWQAC
ncbi:hypothetical protein MMC28_005952 [Mycoblastus sanguinarius]|nr:hypothetical protein [Mycoblastus sanguinarius]